MNSSLDNYQWASNHPGPLSHGELQRFQAGLNDIAGLDVDTSPRWRIVWGQDIARLTGWDRYREEWSLRPEYRWGVAEKHILNPATGLIETRSEWIGIPRYFLEFLLPLSASVSAGGVDADGQRYTEAKTVGRVYGLMCCICQHDEQEQSGWRSCCLRRAQLNQKCVGRYRAPDQIDLDILKADFLARQATLQSRPDEGLTPRDSQALYNQWLYSQLREEEARASLYQATLAEDVRTMTNLFRGNRIFH